MKSSHSRPQHRHDNARGKRYHGRSTIHSTSLLLYVVSLMQSIPASSFLIRDWCALCEYMLHSGYHCCPQYFRFIKGMWRQNHEEIISFVFTMLILIEDAMDVLTDRYSMVIQSLTPSNRVNHWCAWSCVYIIWAYTCCRYFLCL